MNQPLLKVVSSEPVTELKDGVGPTLKALRQARQLSLSDVSLRLKFSTRQIAALEDQDWDRLTQGLPLRGMVKNYARYLETDVDAILAMLDSQTDTPGVLRPDDKLPRVAPVDVPQRERRPRAWGWFVVIVVLLIVAGLYAIERGWVPEAWLIFDWLKP